jgi:hypothetical protein
VQDAQVLLGRPLRLLVQEHIVGQAEATAGKQVGLVAVVGERPRFANQPVDHVPVVDPVLVAAAQARQRLDQLLPVPDLDPLRVEAGLHPLPDQPAGHRVDVAFHPDGAAAVHPHREPLARLQASGRQRSQHGQFLSQTLLPTAVKLPEQPQQKAFVGGPTAEVPAAPQHQGLVQGPLELAVALLDVPILVALARLDGLALQVVVPQ